MSIFFGTPITVWVDVFGVQAQNNNVLGEVGEATVVIKLSGICLSGVTMTRDQKPSSPDKFESNWLSAENLNRLVDVSPDSTFVSRIDNFRFVHVNYRACETYGYSREEFLQMEIFDIEVRSMLRDQVRTLYTETPVGEVVEVVGENKRKDGSTFPVQVRFCKLNDEFAVANVRDITRQKEFEATVEAQTRELRESEAKVKLLLDSTAEGIYGLDMEGLCTFCNSACIKLLGYESEVDLLGHNMHELMHYQKVDGSDYPNSDSRIYQAFRKGEGTHADDEVFWRSDRSSFESEYWSYPILSDGQVVGSVVTFLNITERRRAEAEQREFDLQLKEVQKLESLGVLTGGIAHDFNNILMGILGNAELAKMELSPLSPIQKRLDTILTAGRRAADLCRQMLAYAGKATFVIEKISLPELVAEMNNMLAITISKKAVLKFNIAENVPAINVDSTQLRQVIMNLITNASEAIGDKSGVISINIGAMDCDQTYLSETYLNEALTAGVYTYFEIADTGCGMSSDTRQKLFEPFFTTKFTGRGLGLAAVLGIVRAHKGAIKVYSEEGVGTTIKVLFPAAEESASDLKADEEDATQWMGSGTILLVDDEESVLAVSGDYLKKKGFKVLTAADGRECIDIYRDHSKEIVCVLLDLTMPHMDGEEAYRELRRINNDVKVILCNGYNHQDITNRFVGKGLADFIQKPYGKDELWKKLAEVLEY